jgi:CMP-N-acetylneuraminic acid synthetase
MKFLINQVNILKIYKPNGYVDILKTKHLLKKKNIYGNKILNLYTPKIIEIDDKEDSSLLKKFMNKKN